MPALFIKMSRRSEFDMKVSTADRIEAKDERSRDRNVIGASGTAALMSAMADSAFEAVRAAR